ncbi:MAG: hypothetical protein IJT54_05955 [Candidatus Methanomethylophilaceae archaeon]|nr:hypothetical protein [Candidatus Methanomethylophilaceae archaeon]
MTEIKITCCGGRTLTKGECQEIRELIDMILLVGLDNIDIECDGMKDWQLKRDDE